MKKKIKAPQKKGNTWGDIVFKIYEVSAYLALIALLVAYFYSVNGPYHFETVIVQEIETSRPRVRHPGICGISLETGKEIKVVMDIHGRKLGDTVVARCYDRFPYPRKPEIILPYRE